jgi:hypothetical protein
MTPQRDGLYQHLITVSTFFETQHMEYMVIGGIAVGVWAAPRATIDLDFLVGVDDHGLSSLINAAKEARFVIFDDRPMKFKRVTLLRMLLQPEHGDFLTIDCMLSDDAYKRHALTRALAVPWEGRTIRVAPAEDLILLKLLSARDQDLIDSKNVAQRQMTSLDRTYLTHWAERLGVSGALRDVLGH